jgi:RND family efflux transporter MFP subunit
VRENLMPDTHVETEPTARETDATRSPLRRKRRYRVILFSLIGLAVALGIALSGIFTRQQHEAALTRLTRSEAKPTVAIVTPQHSVIGQELVLPGNIDAWYQAPIYARVPGYLKMWYKDYGAHVKAGDVLAEIDTPDLDQQLEQAKADVGVEQAKYQLAKVTAERWQNLLKSNSVSVQETDVKLGEAAATKAALVAAQARVARLEAMESFKKLVAPFNGIVTARKTDIGALIDVGSGQGPELFAVADISKMRVYVRVPQAQSAQIKVGMSAKLVLPQYPGESFPARVLTTANAIDPSSRTLLVELEADNPEERLQPGTYAEVHFDLPPQPQVLRLPTSALLFREGGLKVAVVGPDDKVKLKKIDVGRDLGTQVEVLAGLEATDRVINSPPDSIREDEVVRIAGSQLGTPANER